jgi:hypothetical protein
MEQSKKARVEFCAPGKAENGLFSIFIGPAPAGFFSVSMQRA